MLPEPAESLLQAVTDSARVASGRYITFLGTSAFIFMVVAGTTHLDLLMGDSSIKLPLFGIGVSLKGFYGLAPWLVLILHLNLLVQCRLLADKLRHFQSNITRLNTRDRHSALNRLPNFPLVQMLACGEIHSRGVHRLITFIFWLSLITAPLLIMLSIQLGFLPYHGDGFTWNHRLVLIIDALALLFMWPGIYAARRRNHAWLAANTLLIVGVSFAACIPDGWLERKIYSRLPALAAAESGHTVGGLRLTAWLFEYSGLKRNLDIGDRYNPITGGEIDNATRNALLSGDNAQIQAVLASVPALDLSGRNLKYARLAGSSLVKARLRDAELQHANLAGAQLQGAQLGFANLARAGLGAAQLQGANLGGARIEGAYLAGARLDGAHIGGARLVGADLSRASLVDANLSGARLDGASLERARLIGADLGNAWLSGANLSSAVLFGADLGGARLDATRLENTNFRSAYLEGTDFSYSRVIEAEFGRFYRGDHADKIVAELGLDDNYLDEFRKLVNAGRFDGSLNDRNRKANCLEDNNYRRVIRCPYEGNDIETYADDLARYLIKLACVDELTTTGLWIHRLTDSPANKSPGTRMLEFERAYFAETAATRLDDADCPGLFNQPEYIKRELRASQWIPAQ